MDSLGARQPQRYALTLTLLVAVAALHLALVSSHWRWPLLALQPDAGFEALEFRLAVLPRLAMALLVGAAMGLSGSVLQQLTQNRLVSPMTIGATSGAWLGLLVATLVFPAFAARHGEWAALGGALASMAVAMLIAGRNGVTGLPLVLAGMALNLLLGALAAALIILHTQSTRGLFIWGAGDLTQIDWHWADWLWPKLLPALLLFVWAPRPLTLLQLGSEGAQARGLNLWPVTLALFLAALWLTAVSVTAVGLIGFIGLIAPNLARLCGARTARDELIYSTALGMLLLLAADALAMVMGRWLGELIPTGATAALIGAPALLWLSRRRLAAEDARALQLPPGAARLGRRRLLLLGLAGVGVVLVSLGVTRTLQGWFFAWPSPLVWSLRWPQVLAAVAAGCGLAVAGSLLQRLMRNPLASPDILGLTAGATLAVMITLMLFGSALFWLTAPVAAFLGSLLVLGLLLLMGRRHRYSPTVMVLVGIALSALFNTLMQFILTQGSPDSLALLGWLAGSTYRVSPQVAGYLGGAVLLLSLLCLLPQRALTLIAIGDEVAASRGLDVPRTRLLLLTLVSLLCALVASLLGPVAFLGLLAPHMAAVLGARRALSQLLLAALIGSLSMLLADWLGRTLIFPLQIPVGIVASVVCGTYFVILLLRYRPR